jgi:hypothetical protein
MGYLRGAGALACVLVLAGCTFGQEEGAEEVTRSQLAVMVLPRDELGSAYATFEVDEDSGRGSARRLAKSTVDPDDNARSVRQGGWSAGYDLGYSDNAQRRLAAKRRRGVLSVGTSVDLFATETDARYFILDEIGEFERFEGKRVQGVKLLRVDVFDVSVGDEGWGVEFDFRAENGKLTSTGVFFRRGRLVATAGFLRADDSDVRAEAASLAQKLEQGIDRVLAGDLRAQPVSLPARKPTATRAQLARMTLALKDLPSGARLADQGRGPATTTAFPTTGPSTWTTPWSGAHISCSCGLTRRSSKPRPPRSRCCATSRLPKDEGPSRAGSYAVSRSSRKRGPGT